MSVTKISLCTMSGLESKDGHRRWLVKKTTQKGEGAERIDKIKLEDPFSITEYENYEKRIRQPSQPAKTSSRENPRLDVPPDDEPNLSPNDCPYSNLEIYKQKLHDLLQLDKVQQEDGSIKISIGEDYKKGDCESDGYYSIHGLLWEILEEYNESGIIVTRWITGIGNHSLPDGLRDVAKPIRLLLIVSRSLQQRADATFHDVQSVVYDTLYTMAKLLRLHNRHDRLSIDIVRPGTLAELEAYLECRKKYDMVHIDTHGYVDTDGTPKLLFAKPGYFPAPKSEKPQFTSATFDYIPAEDVAKLLKRYDITVAVFSSCHVLSKTAEAYYVGFYSALVLDGHGFRSAAIHGRKQQGRRPGRHGDKSWPTVVTYFAADSLHHTDSIPRLGDHIFTHDNSVPVIGAPKSRRLLARLSALHAIALGFGARLLPILTIFSAVLMGIVLFWVPPPIDFVAFKENLENQKLKHSVGLMAFEDRLRCKRKLFIQVDETPPDRKKEEERLDALRDQWLTTNFADIVQIVPASWFKSFWLFLKVCELFRCLRDWWTNCHNSVRVVLIITGLEDIMKKGQRLDMDTINQMDNYIQHMERRYPSSLYLVLMSNENIDWQGRGLSRDKHPWFEAQPFRSRPGFATFREFL
ncbi:hypothetical protein NM208_g3630 [Fusarium decemcellulare]|uniref:Uncharacterized protein n=1 Tax=Fusarium decemcellulare TaxID=57161 RepID=A0ACC1SNE0_9HYPO|nr:hypothetical protein NM208_g3630 [Fusarium decemcellulare]